MLQKVTRMVTCVHTYVHVYVYICVHRVLEVIRLLKSLHFTQVIQTETE